MVRAGIVCAVAMCAAMLWPSPTAIDPPLAIVLADPRVRQDTITATICVSGYTRRERPSHRTTRRIKIERLAALGLGPEHARRFQLDHRLPMILGGAPADPANLVLQDAGEAGRKDGIERKLGCLVCAGTVSLAEARAAVLADWRAARARWLGLTCRRS